MQHVQILEKERMPTKRSALAYWDALYELWKLSWYETRPNQTAVPRCIPVETWLDIINQYRLEHDNQDSTLSVEELMHVAGGLVKSRMASLRLQRVSNSPTFAYSITTNAAVEIQMFLCLHVVDQRLRPGLPGSADQLAALTLHAAQPASSKLHYVNLDMRMATMHGTQGLEHLNAALTNLSGHKRKREALVVKQTNKH